MKLNNLLIFGLIVVLLSSCATSKKIKLANKLFEEGSHYNAADLYEEAHEKKENNTKLTFQLGETNRALKDYEEAAKWYEKTLELNEDAWPEAKFYHSLMLKSQEQYKDAIEGFEDYIATVDGMKKKKGAEYEMLSVLKKRAKLEKEGAELALELMEERPESEVTHVDNGLNNNLQDFSPKFINEDQVLMAALLPEEAIELNKSKQENEDYYSKLYYANRDGANWERELLPDNINSTTSHVGNGVLSTDGNTLYFTKCNELNSHKMTCKILSSKKTEAGWADPVELPEAINKEDFTTTQPAIGLDRDGNEVLYFVSDRNGGRGGLDIWYTIIGKDGSFSRPTNLGRGVNTPYDDVTPFYDQANEILYFSSEGHPGMGGLDVFKVEGNVGDWSDQVVNMGYPLNSGADDLYLALNDAGKKGYLVSNRVGTTSDRGRTCCDDVFKVRLTREVTLIVNAVDSLNNKLNDVSVSLYKAVDNDFDFISSGATSESKLVSFLVEEETYKINGEKEGYWPSILTLNADEISGTDADTITKNLVMRPLKRAVVKNVYFAFDKSNVLELYQKEIDSVYSLMTKYPELVVKLDGHTDNKGSMEYNQVLSEKRAQAVKNYMVKVLEVDKNRILTAGYSFTKPIAPNENPDGSDNPEGRAKNRRVEFKLLSDVNDELPINVEYSTDGEGIVE